MVEILNPWMTLNSEADNSHASDLIAARTDVLQTVGTTVSVRDEPDATDDIGELLRCALMPADPAPSNGFPYGFDPHVFMDTLEAIVEAIDPLPLFLRKAG
jgi:hypothetical protein